jgi:hypothetical protein
MLMSIVVIVRKKKNKKNDRQKNRYDGKRLFLLCDLEAKESVVFMIDRQQKKNEEKEHMLYILQVLYYV